MRAFIAIIFDKDTKQNLISVQDRLRECSGGNFSRPENLHLTLLFLGEIESTKKAISAINQSFTERFSLVFDKTGYFKNSRVYWVGVKKSDQLLRLYYNICKKMSTEGKNFSPHITLGREIDSAPQIDFRKFDMTVTRVSLMKSERIGGKLTYTEIYGKTIGGK